MAAVYKGLFLQLGVDGKLMLSELEQIDSKLRKTQSELNTLQRSLKIEFDGAKFKRAQELAQRAVQESKEKVDLLKKAIAEADKQGVGKSTDGYKDMVKQLEKAELAAQKTNQKLKEINDIKLNHVQGQIDGLNGQMDKVISTSAKVAAAFAAVGAGAVKLGLNAVEMADTIATEADKLGLTSEALQRYNYLALQTDVSNEALAKSIVKINGDIGNLAIGIEDNGNKALLSLIGTTKNADGTAKTAEQTFLEVVTALSQMESQAVRTGIANQIFGERFAKDLNPLFNKAPEDIKAFLDEFEEIGYMSNETVDDLAALDEKLNMTRQIFTQLGAEVGIQVTPFIEDFTEFVKENKEELGQWAGTTMENIIKVAKALYDMRGALVAIVAVFAMLKAALVVANSIIAFKKAMEGATGAMAIFNATVAANPLGALAVVLGLVVGGIVAYKVATGDATSASKELAGEIKNLSDEYERNKKSVQESEQQDISKGEAAKRLSDELYSLNEEIKSGTLTEEEAINSKRRMHSIVDQLNSLIPDLNLAYNSETNELSKQQVQVESLIDSFIRLAKAKAAASLLQDAYISYERAVKQTGEAQAAYDARFEEIKNETNPFRKIVKAFSPSTLGDADNIRVAQETEQKLKADVDYYENLANEYSDVLSDSNKDKPDKPDKPYKPYVPSGGGRGSSSSNSAREAEEAARKAEEQRKAAVKAYEDNITEYERLDKRYNDQKKGYGKLSLNDELYTIGERARRYREYAEEVLNLDYMTEEEKIKLHRQYSEKAGDLDLEYFKFEENIREQATKAVEEEYEKARQLQIEYLNDRKNNVAEVLAKEKESIQAIRDIELKSISDRITAQKELLQTKIDAINEEIKKRRELREDENAEERLDKIRKQIAATEAQILFTKDEDTVRELQKQLIRQQEELTKGLKDQEDTAWYRQKDLEIKEIESKMDDLSDREKELIARANAAAQQEEARAARRATTKRLEAEQNAKNSAMSLYNNYYDTSNINNTYNQQKGTVVIKDATPTSQQIANAMNKILQGKG